MTGGVNIGKSFAREVLSRDPGVVKVIETLIARECIRCFWEKKGRFVGAGTPRD